ncbi:MAG: hypothetical protein Q8O42_03115 [Acidobacteriota bacterium]|nr:hypothetical protein [Acidobacteriota bacterium]
MRSLRVLLAIVAAVALTGCINSTTLIKVNADGSGTVEQTTLMNMAAIKSMMPGAEKQMGGAVVNKADLERTAARMGKGVRLVSADPAKGANGWEGSKAIFGFDDINQVQVSTGPSMSGGTSDRMGSEPTSQDPVRFTLSRAGGTSTLTIAFVDKPAGDKPDNGANPMGDMDLTNPMMMGMLKSMFGGFKLNIDLEVAGAIVKTNAEYVTGSRLTLLEMDLDSLLADEAKLKALQGQIGAEPSLSAIKPFLKDIKGIKIDGPTINVTFR